MSVIPIPGMNTETLAKTSTEAKIPRRDFPVVPGRYTSFTGLVEKVEIKTIGDDDKLAIICRNGECVAELLINLDARKTNTESKKTVDEQVEMNLATLNKAVKTLAIYNQLGQIDTDLFGKARGLKLAFAGKQTGIRTWENKAYPKTSFVFNGAAEAVTPVEPWTGGAPLGQASPSTAGASAVDAFDDIPF